MQFDGDTFVKEFDETRLTKQFGRVASVMGSGEWMTLEEIQRECHRILIRLGISGYDSVQSISARLRDLRKARNGSLIVERRRRGVPGSGLFEYRVSK